MAKIHGRLSTFTWNSVAVNGVMDLSTNLDRSAIETTTHDTGDAREFIANRLSGTIDLTLKWDETDSGQSGMADDFFAGTSRSIVFRMETGSGNHEYTGTALITTWNPSGPNDDAAEVSVSLQWSGTITQATQ